MLSTCQAMWLMAWRLTKLYEAGAMTHEQVGAGKAGQCAALLMG